MSVDTCFIKRRKDIYNRKPIVNVSGVGNKVTAHATLRQATNPKQEEKKRRRKEKDSPPYNPSLVSM
jgi:hypothetical protein